MDIPPDIEAAYAIPGKVPAAITPEYLAENRDRAPIIAIIIIGVFAILLAVLRSYARISVIKEFGIDDALALLTIPIYIAFIVLCIILIKLGSGRHIEYIQYVLDNHETNVTEILDFIAHLLYTTALFVCRLSGLAFYKRIVTVSSSKFTIAIWAATAFLIAGFLPQILLLIFHCYPVTGLWPYAWQSTSNDYKCLQWGLVYSVNSSVSLICDLILFAIPAVIISRLHASRRRKWILSLILFPGVLVIIISCVRLDLVIKGQWQTDQAWWYNPMLAVENAEIGGTIIALAVPGLQPLFVRWISTSRLSSSKSGANSSPISLGSRGKSQSDHRLGSAKRYERTESDDSVTAFKARTKDSDDIILESDRSEYSAAMLTRKREHIP